MKNSIIRSNKLLLLIALSGTFQWACQTQQQPGVADTSAAAQPVASPAATPAPAPVSDMDWVYAGVEFNMPRVEEPQIPDNTVSIVDFGGQADGLTKNTQAFEKAIAALAAQGGGTLVIPRGIWLTGPIVLKSNINLHAEAGALVVFSKDFDDYPIIATSFEGLNTYRCLSPIYGKDLENVAITGSGTFDGSGDAWRPVKKSKLTESQWKAKLKSGGVLSDDGSMWYPSESAKRGDTPGSNFNVPSFSTKEEYEAVRDYLRPVMVSLVNCNRVLLDGPTFQNSPAWNLHPLMSRNVILRNLNVRNPWYSQNGDGVDLESCQNALIYNNTFDVGDDAICFKSGKNKDGRERGIPTENVIVKNNVVYHGHGGFVVGSEMSGGIRNVHVSNCTFIGTDVGLRFKSTRGRGGVVENIWISNIDMIDIPTHAISFNLFYGGNSPVLEADQRASDEKRDEKAVSVTEETPSFRNIYMKNIRATGSGVAAQFQGLPEMNLKNVRLENSVLEAKEGITLIDADGLVLSNVRVLQEKGPAFTIYNSKNVALNKLSYANTTAPVVRVLGPLTRNISLENKDFTDVSSQISRGKELSANAVTIK